MITRLALHTNTTRKRGSRKSTNARWCAGLALIVLLTAQYSHAAERGFTTAGKSFTGQLVAIDNSWSASFTGQVPMPGTQIVYWGQLAENQFDTTVILSDDSALVGTILTFSPKQLTIGNDPQSLRDSLWSKVELSTEVVRGAIIRSLPELADRDRLLQDVKQHRGKDDMVWLGNGDRLEGQLLSSQLQGRGGKWSVHTDSGNVDVDPENVLAIALHNSQQDSNIDAPNIAVIGFRDGSVIRVAEVRSTTTNYEFKLVCGATLSIDMGTFAGQVCYFRPPNDAVTYLSDLKSVGYRHIPYLSTEWPYHDDQSVLGTRLRWHESVIEKGLGVHSTSRLAYDIPQGTRRFQAELALDAVAGDQGSVVYRVYLQSAAGQWNLAYESPVIRGNEEPQLLNLETGAARRIALIVDFADRGDEMDRANWLMARFVK